MNIIKILFIIILINNAIVFILEMNEVVKNIVKIGSERIGSDKD